MHFNAYIGPIVVPFMENEAPTSKFTTLILVFDDI